MSGFRSKQYIKAARGNVPADIVFYNGEVFNPFTCEWDNSGFAVKNGIIIGNGDYHGVQEYDLRGRRVVPGLIDAHVHIESSLLCPHEYARLIVQHGTTTVIADPHEIGNVCGSAGLEYMLAEREGLPVDIFIMLPSCVPATPLERAGAVLKASDLSEFAGMSGVLGLAEMMNVPGVLSLDEEVLKKISMFPLVDGHAPLLSGNDLNAYILAGIQSDHECTSAAEALEKIRKGMFIFIREGSTEKNIRELVPVITGHTACRCCFATDDRHVDILVKDGHIDDCIRKAIEYGTEPELAIRMATLTPAERFRLSDRGALSPGKIADFCILKPDSVFDVDTTFKCGKCVTNSRYQQKGCISKKFLCNVPSDQDMFISGSGTARVIGIVPHQILTSTLTYEIDKNTIPDLTRDILKIVVCSRYLKHSVGTGLVHGFGLKTGALASSVSHDTHNIIATGTDDHDIRTAISTIISGGGGMAAVSGKKVTYLPLECAGLMSVRCYEDVYDLLLALNRHAAEMGAITDPFMYLSFLALTVIPHLRVTEHGLFDVDSFRHVPVFT
jgi:adenine deaminase